MSDRKNTHEPILLDVKGVANMLGVSTNSVRNYDVEGRIGPMAIKLGRLKKWKKEEIEKWVEAGCPGRARWQSRRRQGGRRPEMKCMLAS